MNEELLIKLRIVNIRLIIVFIIYSSIDSGFSKDRRGISGMATNRMVEKLFC